MVRIAPVNLYYNPKTLWFDAGELDINPGDGLVVTTARGIEFGRAAAEVFEATDDQVKKLKTPLKPVKRLATPEDEEKVLEMDRLSAEALPIFKEMAAEANADMHPVSVEYLLDGDKAVFYFEAEERVDFRDLVRKLAARFHVRIDMRQIGVRDEARMVGGLGHCGQELCCKRLGGEFCPVSIRMAKEQDLSLNPQKISGVCGRLMCCLRYEFEAYKDFKSRAPKQNSQVETPAGMAKVVDLDVPREIVALKVEGEKPVRVPLADFEPPEEGSNRPKKVGEEAWEAANAQAIMPGVGESSIFATTQLTGSDKLADPTSVRRTGRGGTQKQRSGGNGTGSSNGGSNGSSNGGSNRNRNGNTTSKPAEAASSSGRKPRRRRSTKVGGEGAPVENAEAQKRKQKQPAPGQGQQKKRTGGNSSGGNAKKQQGARTGDVPKKQNQPSKQKQQGGAKQGGPRPGQKSSGLRQGQNANSQQPRAERSDGAPTGDGGHRRTRRRIHKAGGGEANGGAQGGTSTNGGNGGA